MAQIRSIHDRRRLRAELKVTLARLRRTRGSTAAGRRARGLAIDGLESTLRGVESLIAFDENDSGNIAAATRDAKRADRFLAAWRRSAPRGRPRARDAARRRQRLLTKRTDFADAPNAGTYFVAHGVTEL